MNFDERWDAQDEGRQGREGRARDGTNSDCAPQKAFAVVTVVYPRLP